MVGGDKPLEPGAHSDRAAGLLQKIEEWALELRNLSDQGVELPGELAGGFLRIGGNDSSTWRLGERVKELNALHRLTELLTAQPEDMPLLLRNIAELVREAFQYPERTGVRLECGAECFETDNFSADGPLLEETFSCGVDRSGKISVKLMFENPEEGQVHSAAHFLEEERHLVRSVGEILHLYLGGRSAVADLTANERYYRMLFEHNPHPMWVYDKKTLRFLSVNEAAVRQYGYTREEFLQMTIADIRPPEDVEALRQCVAESPAGFMNAGFWRHQRKDGSLITVEVYSNVFESPGTEGELVLALDVTERMRAEAGLREREALLALAQDIGKIGTWIVDLPTGRLTWSEQTLRIFGVSAENFGGRFEDFIAMVLTEDLPRFEAFRAAMESSNEPAEIEYRIRRTDGARRWLFERAQLERDASGEPTRRVGMVMDITEEKQAERKLQLLAAALNQAADPVFITDKDAVVEWVNQAFEKVTGYTSKEAVGRPVGQLMNSGRHDAAFFKNMWDTLFAGEIWGGEIINRNCEGEEIPFHLTITPVEAKERDHVHFISILRDLREAKRREQLELRNQRMESIGTLAGGIAHDLNNILSPILMSVDLLKKRTEGADLKAILETVEISARRGSDLVRQILNFSRGIEGKRGPVQLGPLAEELALLIRETFPKDILLETHIDRNLWKVHGDATQIQQVMMNLCINARDAMPDGGVIRLMVRNTVVDESYARMNPNSKTGGYVALSVEDSGEGIPPEIQARIFDPFFTTKDPGRGTGLGLATCHRIIRDHGGFINFYSEPGKGTQFKVYLPAEAVEEEMERVSTESSGLPRGKGETVLLVDDEEIVIEIVRKSMERHGYKVLTAGNGAEAVAIYSKRLKEIDVVLTDMAMPVMDGYATIRALRVLNPEVRIIGSSGIGSNGHMARALGAGVAHFIVKPYTAESVLRVLFQVLNES